MGAFDGLGKWFKKRVDDSSRAFDQINPLDNGRTWKQRTPTTNESSFNQAVGFSRNVGKGVFGGSAKFLNTGALAADQIGATGRGYLADITGNQRASRNANQAYMNAAKRWTNGGGLLGAGTVFRTPDEVIQGDPLTVAKRVGYGTANAGLEAASLGLGGFSAKQIANQGIKAGLRSQAPTLAKNAALNFGQGASYTLANDGGVKDALKSGGINSLVGTGADIALGGVAMAPAAINSRIPRTAYRSGVKGEPTTFVAKSKEMAAKYNDRPGSKMQQFTYKPKDVLDPTNAKGRQILEKAFGKDGLKKMTNTRSGLIDPQYETMVNQIAKSNGYKMVAMDEAVGLRPKREVLPRDTRTFSVADPKGVKSTEFGSNPVPLGMGIKGVDGSDLSAPLPKRQNPSQGVPRKIESTQLPAQPNRALSRPTSQTLSDELSSATNNTPMTIKVKGPMSDADYLSRYGKDRSGKDIKVKPFTADDYAFETWKDRSALALGRETLDRNLDRVAGADAPRIKKFLVDASRENETARANFLNSKRTEVRNVIDQLGIKKKSKESALVQKYGEGLIDLPTLVDMAGDSQKAGRIVEASKYFRQQYDDLLDTWNVQRKKYGYDEVPKRADYFRHFQEINDGINALGMIGNARDLPTGISGITDIFNPSKPFSNAELRRLGNDTTYDAVGGFDNYLDNVSRQIFHTDTVQRGRYIENSIRRAADSNPEIELPNFVANVGEWTNLVSGKKSRIDRAAEALVGRKIYATANALRQQTGANMVGANLASAMSNFIPLTQSLSTTKKTAAIRGLMDTMGTPFKGKLSEIDGQQSGFLTRRFVKESIQDRGVKKASSVASTPFKLVDEFTSRSIVAGKYYEGLESGLSPKQAMKAADDYASKIISDRSVGQAANIMNSQTTGFFTQFQNEVNNQVSFLMRDIPELAGRNPAKVASALTQFMVFSYLFNEGYERVMGRRPQLDPIDAGLQAFGVGGENQDKSLQERLSGSYEDIATGLPFTSVFTGGRLPMSAALPDVGALKKGVSNAIAGEGAVARNLHKGLSGPAFYLAPPFGGGQVKKTLEAGNTMSKGYSETPSGQVRFEADKDPLNRAKSLLFGQYATDAGQQYLKQGIKPYSAKDSEMYKTTGDSGVLRVADQNRAINQEKIKIKGSDDGLKQLSDGSYYGKVGNSYKQFESQEDYRISKSKYEFDKSGKKTQIIGNRYYFRNKSGGVSSKPLPQHKYETIDSDTTLALDRAKSKNDVGAWFDAADKKITAIDTYLKTLDPELDHKEINSLTKKREDLIDDANKYAGYGGFKKGGSGRRGRAGARRAVKVRPISEGSLSPVIKLSGGSKAPNISLKKPGISVRTKKGKVSFKAQKPARIKG